MTPPDGPATPTSNVDDPEWIKGLVAKALLQAADEGTESAAMAPTPVGRPAATWPDLTPLDTSSYSRERAASSVAPQQPGPAAAPAVPPNAVPPNAVPPNAVPVVETVPRDLEARESMAIPQHVAPQHVAPQHVAPQHVAPQHVAPPAHDVLPAEVPAPVLESIADARADADADAVMVEATATTEGFRASDIRTVLEWLLVIVSALVVALIIKALVLQAFWIPSESMETTVNKGDRILVNKVSYRLHDVRRGDLVVFEKLDGTPGDTKDLIKRAIALPGETIEIRNDGRIWIWGAGETPADAKLLEEPYLDPQNAVLNAPSASDPLTADVWDDRCTNQPRTPGRCTLDDSSYFMMGDNRGRSSDSRFFGPIPEDNLVGRAFLRIWPLGEIGTL